MGGHISRTTNGAAVVALTAGRRRTRSRIATVAALSALAALALALASSADGRPAASSRRSVAVLRLPFHPLGGVNVIAAGRYTLLGGTTLIDESTAARTPLTPPAACHAAAVGAPWVAFDCAAAGDVPAPELYSIPSAAWTAVALAPGIAATCAAAQDGQGCRITGVGRSWIAIFDGQCYHCRGAVLFQSVATGQTRPDPTAATARPDLDSPTLAARVCSPLRLPPSLVDDAGTQVPALGSLTFSGRYALATSTSADGLTSTYLERCGQHVHTFLCHCSGARSGSFGALAINGSLAVWAPTGSTHLDGLYLATRRRFLIPLPAAETAQAGTIDLQLSSRTLYVASSASPIAVFAAAAPR
jgi:hypothetical protein